MRTHWPAAPSGAAGFFLGIGGVGEKKYWTNAVLTERSQSIYITKASTSGVPDRGIAAAPKPCRWDARGDLTAKQIGC